MKQKKTLIIVSVIAFVLLIGAIAYGASGDKFLGLITKPGSKETKSTSQLTKPGPQVKPGTQSTDNTTSTKPTSRPSWWCISEERWEELYGWDEEWTEDSEGTIPKPPKIFTIGGVLGIISQTTSEAGLVVEDYEDFESQIESWERNDILGEGSRTFELPDGNGTFVPGTDGGGTIENLPGTDGEPEIDIDEPEGNEEEPEEENPHIWIGAACGCDPGGKIYVPELDESYLCPKNGFSYVEEGVTSENVEYSLYVYTEGLWWCEEKWHCPEDYRVDWGKLYDQCYELAIKNKMKACGERLSEQPNTNIASVCAAFVPEIEDRLENLECPDEEICEEYMDSINAGLGTEEISEELGIDSEDVALCRDFELEGWNGSWYW